MEQHVLPSRTMIWWLLLSGLALVVTTSGVYYHMAVLEPQASTYNSSLQVAAGKLKNASTKLANISDKMLLETEQSTLEEKLAQIKALALESKQVRSELSVFRKASENIIIYPYNFTSSLYQKSLASKMQSEATADQMDEVLDEYDQFLSFLPKYFVARQYVNDALSGFNNLTNLNELANQSDEIGLIATNIRQKTTMLTVGSSPRGFEDITEKSIALHGYVAEGFSALSASLSPPVDANIYAAAYRLEQLTAENDTLNNSALDQALQQSPILKDISDLPSVMDRLTF